MKALWLKRDSVPARLKPHPWNSSQGASTFSNCCLQRGSPAHASHVKEPVVAVRICVFIPVCREEGIVFVRAYTHGAVRKCQQRSSLGSVSAARISLSIPPRTLSNLPTFERGLFQATCTRKLSATAAFLGFMLERNPRHLRRTAMPLTIRVLAFESIGKYTGNSKQMWNVGKVPVLVQVFTSSMGCSEGRVWTSSRTSSRSSACPYAFRALTQHMPANSHVGTACMVTPSVGIHVCKGIRKCTQARDLTRSVRAASFTREASQRSHTSVPPVVKASATGLS